MADAIKDDFPQTGRETSWFKQLEYKLALLERFDNAVLCKAEDEDDVLNRLDDNNPLHTEASLEIRLLRREIEHLFKLNDSLMESLLRKGARP